ncbi:MAG: GNAT family N-acetyltransferase [bacterium]
MVRPAPLAPGAGVLDWRRPAGQLARTVRALNGAPQSPIAWATLAIGREAIVVERADVEARDQPSEAGTVLALDPQGLTVAAGAGALRITRIWRLDGRALRFTDLPVAAGERLPLPDAAALEALDQKWRPDADFWARRLSEARPLPLPWGEAGAPQAGGRLGRRGLDDGAVLTAACVLLARAAETWQFDVGVTDTERLRDVGPLEAWFSPQVPMRVELHPDADATAAAAIVLDAWRAARRSGHRRDLGPRLAGRRGPDLEAILLARVDDASAFIPPREAIVACVFDGASARWWAPASVLGSLERGFAALLAGPPGVPIGRLPLQSPADLARLEALHGPVAPPTPLRVSDAILGRAAATPDADALVADGRPLSFASFEVRVNRLARHLQSLGLGREDRVATLLPEVGDALVATLAILTAGATAVPLDPDTRPDRLARQQTDARVDATITCEALRPRVSQGRQIISVDTDRATIEAWPADPSCPAEVGDVALVAFAADGHHGVPLTHAQLVGLFGAVDEVVEKRAGVWLGLGPPFAVTGLVDRLWALSRGFELVAPDPAAERAVTLSLACASADPAVLATVARYADRHGFDALWLLDWGVAGATLPDAAVAAAAAATATERVGLRAVTRLPADPDRLLEIWSLINGLSAGRLGLALVADSLRRLDASLAQLRTIGGAEASPPAWVVADDAATFMAAGRAGASVVSVIRAGLLAELPGLVTRYRAARADARHPGPGHVTLVVPTLIGDDDQTVRAWARAPMAGWLRRTAGPREPVALDQVALAGDVERARGWLALAARAGIDEVACLLDFGLPAAALRAHLGGLGALREAPASEGPSLADRLERDGVTHLEVPVDRLRRLLGEPGVDQALPRLRHLLITGDPVPADLARATRAAVGPLVPVTRRVDLPEAGGWCTTHPIAGDEGALPLGFPLAHVRAHVLDSRGEPPPLGAPGELCVGGPGVSVLGAHAARRVAGPDGPLLRTGLRVRQTLDGTLEPAPDPPPPGEPPRPTPASPSTAPPGARRRHRHPGGPRHPRAARRRRRPLRPARRSGPARPHRRGADRRPQPRGARRRPLRAPQHPRPRPPPARRGRSHLGRAPQAPPPPRLSTMDANPPNSLMIRPIAPPDSPAVAALIRAVMPTFGCVGPGFAIEDAEVDDMATAYGAPARPTTSSRPTAGWWVAAASRPARRAPAVCELRKMYFYPEIRGLGLGRRLLALCLDTARDLGFTTCYLETMNEMEAACRLYEAFGFERLHAPMGATGHFGCNRRYARPL